VGALGPSRSFQAAVGSGKSCQPSAHRFAGGVDGGRTSSTQAQDLSAFAHDPMEDRTGFPPHSPCGNASPSSWSGSPPMSDEPPGWRPPSLRIHCDVDTTPHSCGRRGHHPTELLKPPVGALGPSRSFQAAVGSGNSCQPSAHRLEPRHTQRLTQGPSVSESKIYNLLPVIYQFLPVGPLVSYQSRPVPIIARWQLLRPSVRESAPVLQPAAAAGPGVGRQASGAPPAG